MNAASSQTGEGTHPTQDAEAAEPSDAEAAAPGEAQGPGPSGRKVVPDAGQELSSGEG